MISQHRRTTSMLREASELFDNDTYNKIILSIHKTKVGLSKGVLVNFTGNCKGRSVDVKKDGHYLITNANKVSITAEITGEVEAKEIRSAITNAKLKATTVIVTDDRSDMDLSNVEAKQIQINSVNNVGLNIKADTDFMYINWEGGDLPEGYYIPLVIEGNINKLNIGTAYILTSVPSSVQLIDFTGIINCKYSGKLRTVNAACAMLNLHHDVEWSTEDKPKAIKAYNSLKREFDSRLNRMKDWAFTEERLKYLQEHGQELIQQRLNRLLGTI